MECTDPVIHCCLGKSLDLNLQPVAAELSNCSFNFHPYVEGVKTKQNSSFMSTIKGGGRRRITIHYIILDALFSLESQLLF